MRSSCDASATRATDVRRPTRSRPRRTLPSRRGPVYAPAGLVRALWACTGAIVVAALVVATVGARPVEGGGSGGGPSSRVAIFFYPWYGTPARDGSYQHWSQHGNDPPASIASSFYPARGVYSSSDPGVLSAQMADIAGAQIRVVIVSWWGTGSVEDARLPMVLATAQSYGLRVAVHV